MFFSFAHPSIPAIRLDVKVNEDYEVLACALVTIQPDGSDLREELVPGPMGTLPGNRLHEVGFDPIELGFQIEEAVDDRAERLGRSAL